MGSDIASRIDVSYEVLGHVGHPAKGVFPEEGKDYTTLAFTDWADDFQPTLIKWANGVLDDFTLREASIHNKRNVMGWKPTWREVSKQAEALYYQIKDPEQKAQLREIMDSVSAILKE